MKKIHLWSVEKQKDGALAAVPVSGVKNSETEQQLEDLLVASPDLLMKGLKLVGRQVPTAGGYLDLLGVDEDGRVVVFELKRGVLTRDAVAQVLDYGSDLANQRADQFAKLVEKNSGQRGIEPLEDFADWYRQEYPNNDEPLSEVPRLVLVGLGVDDRARRIVDFLAGAGVDVQLITFHAFETDGRQFLARQVESARVSPPPGGGTKKLNQEALLKSAEGLGVKGLLEEVANYVDGLLPAYRWPGKTAYSFSMQERTSEGRPTLRSYVAIYLNPKEPGSLTLLVTPRASEIAAEATRDFCSRVDAARESAKSYAAAEVQLTSQNWPTVKEPLRELLRAMEVGWKASREEEPVEEDSE